MSGRGRSGRRSMSRDAGSSVRGRRSGQALGAKAREQLVAAHELVAAGKHLEAAPALASVAQVARQRSLPRVAARLHAEAALAHVAGGAADDGAAAAREALADAELDPARKNAARHIGDVLAALRAAEYGEVDALEAAARTSLGVSSISTTAQEGEPTVNRAMRRRLPRTCPTCGVAVKAETSAFHAEGGADCAMCGGVLAG